MVPRNLGTCSSVRLNIAVRLTADDTLVRSRAITASHKLGTFVTEIVKRPRSSIVVMVILFRPNLLTSLPPGMCSP